MEQLIFKDFEVKFNYQEISDRLRIRPDTKADRQLKGLLEIAAPLAKPKAAVKFVQPEPEGNGHVNIEGILFKSQLLMEQLSGLDLAFPYVATCGRELDDWAKGLKGLEQFLADEIMITALRQAVLQLETYLLGHFELPTVSAMNPGSLPEWPITEQKGLFALMGELPGQIGMELLPSFLMNPGKSVSGIFFKTDEKYHNCQLCSKLDCPSRRAPFQGEGQGLAGH